MLGNVFFICLIQKDFDRRQNKKKGVMQVVGI